VGLPCGRPRLRGAHLHPALPKEPPVSSLSLSAESPGLIAETVLLPPLARSRQDHFACGSLRRLPTPAHAAVSYNLAAARRPTGFTSPGSSRVEDLPVMFQTGSSLGSLPSEASPRRRRQILSDRAVPPAVSHLAVSRLRGFELSATSRLAARVPPSVRVRSPTTTLFTSPKGRSSPGCFPPSRMTFRPRPALLPDSSLGLCRASAPSTPLAVHREPQRTCALQSVREPEV
jgi:hypothetical protein